MSWTPLNLATPASDAIALSQSLSVVSVTPWSHQLDARGWLSFPDAVELLINKIVSQSSGGIFAVAVTAANLSDLVIQIEAITTGLPVRELLQWKRQASTLVTLEQTKLDLVEPVDDVPVTMIAAIPEIKKRMEKAISLKALTDASDLAASDPLTNLTTFENAKTAHDDAVNLALPDLAGGDGWRFYSDGDIAADLRTGHPGPEYTLTAILAFSGSPADLAYLVELMP